MRTDVHRLSPTSQIGLYPREDIASYTETTTFDKILLVIENTKTAIMQVAEKKENYNEPPFDDLNKL